MNLIPNPDPEKFLDLEYIPTQFTQKSIFIEAGISKEELIYTIKNYNLIFGTINIQTLEEFYIPYPYERYYDSVNKIIKKFLMDNFQNFLNLNPENALDIKFKLVSPEEDFILDKVCLNLNIVQAILLTLYTYAETETQFNNIKANASAYPSYVAAITAMPLIMIYKEGNNIKTWTRSSTEFKDPMKEFKEFLEIAKTKTFYYAGITGQTTTNVEAVNVLANNQLRYAHFHKFRNQ